MGRSLLSRCLLLTLALTLGGCGFQLRGSGGGTSLPESWQSMYLDSSSPNSEFTRVLKTQFTAAGVRWTDAASADYRLSLGPERFQQRNLSVNAQARASEFELSMRARFAVMDGSGATIIEPGMAEVIRQMQNDPRNVVGKAEEIRILQREMRTDLAQQVLRRISFYAASTR
jgi:LPS-assembly lipoprotein